MSTTKAPPNALKQSSAQAGAVKGAASGLPPKLTNLYYLRAVGTPKRCFVCSKETTSCLATSDVSDFLYSCPTHLSDRGFASPAPASNSPQSSQSTSPAPSSSSSVPQSEIDKVKKEYEDKLRLKKLQAEIDSVKADAASKDRSWISSGFKVAGNAVSSLASTASSSLFSNQDPTSLDPTASPIGAAISTETLPKIYVLHRDIFRIRTDLYKKTWQNKLAKERAETLRLPSTPRGSFTSSSGPSGAS